MDKPLDIKTLTVTELKALKSDCYEIISLNQQNVSIINQEITSRTKPEESDGGDTEKN